MESYIFIIIFIMIVIIGGVYNRISKKKQLLMKLRNQYGSTPEEKEYAFEEIAYYHDVVKSRIEDNEQIDQVTWNDLEMMHVFKRISTCLSFVGEQVLYSRLHLTNRKKECRDNFENKVKFFSENSKQRESMQKLFANLGRLDIGYFSPKFMTDIDSYTIANIQVYKWLNRGLILSFLPAIVFTDWMLLIMPALIFVINIAVYTSVKYKYESEINVLSHVLSVVSTGNVIANSKKLEYEHKFGDLKDKTKVFKHSIQKISRITNRKHLTAEGDLFTFVYDYIIGGTLWDFIVYERMINNLKANKEIYLELYELVGEIEVAISVASYRESVSMYCLPEFHDDNEVEVEDLFHPLLDEPVSNSIRLNNNCIITGSNASGKSTYIKALIVNVILANSINTCMATKARIPDAHVITSMAVRDDLMSSESYYIKEIKYMNRIIQSLSKDRLVICAIDEILKGTNTGERIAASLAILHYVTQKNCLAIVASHDIEIAESLENVFDNYHFRDQILDHDIIFDYKLYKGISKTKNAIRLLEYVGFPNEIVNDAKRIYAN